MGIKRILSHIFGTIMLFFGLVMFFAGDVDSKSIMIGISFILIALIIYPTFNYICSLFKTNFSIGRKITLAVGTYLIQPILFTSDEITYAHISTYIVVVLLYWGLIFGTNKEKRKITENTFSVNNSDEISINSENKYTELSKKFIALATEFQTLMNEIENKEINYNDIYVKLCDFEKKYFDLEREFIENNNDYLDSMKSEIKYDTEEKQVLESLNKKLKDTIDIFIIEFHNASMTQILSAEYENSKKLLTEHIQRIKELRSINENCNINIFNIIYSDTNSVLNNLDIIHYNYNHSIFNGYDSKSMDDTNNITELINLFYDRYSQLPFGIECNYNNPLIKWNDIKNSIIKFNKDEDVEIIIKNFISNMAPKDNKIIMMDQDYMIMQQFNGIPHLGWPGPVSTNAEGTEKYLKEIVVDSEKRNHMFLQTGTRSIEEYNQFVDNWNKKHSSNEQLDKMPTITVFISDIYTIVSNNYLKDMLIKLVVKSEKVGIKFILFTKINIYKVNLGMATDFFEKYQNPDNNELFLLGKKDTDERISFDENMTGLEFEAFSKELLKANGFDNVEVTTSSHDFGVDVIAYKDNIKYAIQCKKYSSKVGLKAVQEVIGSKSMHKCHVGVVLTNNYFPKSAIELAEKNNILLWDRNKLNELLKKYQDKNVEIL